MRSLDDQKFGYNVIICFCNRRKKEEKLLYPNIELSVA